MRMNLGEITNIRRETEMPSADAVSQLPQLIHDHEADLLARWLEKLKDSGGDGAGRIREGELQTQCRNFLHLLRGVLASGRSADIQTPAFAAARDFLGEISRSRAVQGFSPTETALFIFSLKEPIFALIQRQAAKSATAAMNEIWTISVLIDQLGLYTMEVFQKSREEVIIRQQQEIAELSTPVVRLWDGVLALPLIGTLDSTRTQVVMENLLQAIVDQIRRHRDHRHHRRADGRHPRRPASSQNHRRRAADGRGLHHFGDPSADRANHGASRRRIECRLESVAG